MKLKQLEVLKSITDDVEVLRNVIDNDERVIDEIIKALRDVKRKELDEKLDYVYISKYIAKLYDYLINTKYYGKDRSCPFNILEVEEQNDIISNTGENIRRLLISMASLDRVNISNLLDLWKKYNYDNDVYNILINRNIQKQKYEDIEKLVECYDKYVYAYRCSNFDLASFILELINSRTIDQIIYTINNNHVFNVTMYNTALIKNRDHSSVESLIKTYDRALVEVKEGRSDLSLDERRNDIKNLVNNGSLVINRNVLQQENLIGYFTKNPLSGVYQIIINSLVLTKRNYFEQKELIDFYLSDPTKEMLDIILNKKLLELPHDKHNEIICLYKNDSSKDIYNAIMEGNDLSFDYLNEKIRNLFKSKTNIKSAIDNFTSIDEIYDSLKNSNVKTFDSDTRIIDKKLMMSKEVKKD